MIRKQEKKDISGPKEMLSCVKETELCSFDALLILKLHIHVGLRLWEQLLLLLFKPLWNVWKSSLTVLNVIFLSFYFFREQFVYMLFLVLWLLSVTSWMKSKGWEGKNFDKLWQKKLYFSFLKSVNRKVFNGFIWISL